jgi:hypothetical protein
MKSAKKLFILAAFTSIVAVACSTDGPDEPKDRHNDYTGLFDPITVELKASDIHDGKAVLDLPLASGASVSAELELLAGSLSPGRITVQLAPHGLFAVGANGAPVEVAADQADDVLNDAQATSLCGIYPLSAVGTVKLPDGMEKQIGVSLAASETGYGPGDAEMKGCRFVQDPGLPNASCGNDCEAGIWPFTFSGKCDHTDINVPWWDGEKWIKVPMWLCYCNTSAQVAVTPTPSPETTPVSTEPTPTEPAPTETASTEPTGSPGI